MTVGAISVLFQQPPVFSMPARNVVTLFDGIKALDRTRSIRKPNAHLIYEDESVERRTRVFALYDAERCELQIVTEPPEPLKLFLMVGGRTFEQQFDHHGSASVEVCIDGLIAAAGGAIAVWVVE